MVDSTKDYHPVIKEIVALTLECLFSSAESSVALCQASVQKIFSIILLQMEDEGFPKVREGTFTSSRSTEELLGLYGRLLRWTRLI